MDGPLMDVVPAHGAVEGVVRSSRARRAVRAAPPGWNLNVVYQADPDDGGDAVYVRMPCGCAEDRTLEPTMRPRRSSTPCPTRPDSSGRAGKSQHLGFLQMCTESAHELSGSKCSW